jgi:hypothetical protein
MSPSLPRAPGQRGYELVDVAAGVYLAGQVGAVEVDRQSFGDAERHRAALTQPDPGPLGRAGCLQRSGHQLERLWRVAVDIKVDITDERLPLSAQQGACAGDPAAGHADAEDLPQGDLIAGAAVQRAQPGIQGD